MDISSQEVFGLTVSPVELIIRGTAVYLFLIFVFRTVLQRDIGAVGVADILLLVIVADASQNAMAGEHKSVTDGLILVSTILGWNVLFDFLSYRFPRIRKILQPPVLRLVRDGEILHRNMRREFITEDELWAKLRENGIDKLEDVRSATMESDGTIAVIKREGSGETSKPPKNHRPV